MTFFEFYSIFCISWNSPELRRCFYTQNIQSKLALHQNNHCNNNNKKNDKKFFQSVRQKWARNSNMSKKMLSKLNWMQSYWLKENSTNRKELMIVGTDSRKMWPNFSLLANVLMKWFFRIAECCRNVHLSSNVLFQRHFITMFFFISSPR